MHNLPGEWPSVWVGTARGDQANPRQGSNAKLTHRGPTDETVVVIKRFAVEGMVTCQRIKQTVSNRMLRRRVEHEVDDKLSVNSIVMRLALRVLSKLTVYLASSFSMQIKHEDTKQEKWNNLTYH